MMMKWSMSALQQEKMTELRDKLQGAMDDIGWNDKEKMDELMDTVLTQQPAAN